MKLLPERKSHFFALTFADQEVQLIQAGNRNKIRKAVTLKLTPGLIVRGRVKKPQALSQVLAQFLKGQKLKTRFVAVGLSEVATFSRTLELPDLPTEELSDAVRWQVEPLLPMSLNEAYLDWLLLDKKAGRVRVLVMALPSKVVEAYAKILEGLAYQPVAFEPTSLSLARLVKKETPGSLVIEIKANGAVLVVVGNSGDIELTSTASFSEKDRQEELLTATASLLSFYQKKFGQDKKVAKIFLCGPQANNSLVRALKQKTSLEVSLVAIKPLVVAATVSLATKDVAAPIDETTINLIPPRIQGVYDRVEKGRVLGNWIKLWLFGLFLIFFVFSVTAAQVYFGLKNLEGQIISLQVGITPQMRLVEEQAKLVNHRAQQILTLADSQSDLVALIITIQEAAPDQVSLKHLALDFNQNQIVVNGLSENRDQLLAFQDSLEATNQFSQVRVPLSSLEQETNVNFTISLSAKQAN